MVQRPRERTAEIRQYSGRLLKTKGLVDLLWEKPRSSFANSDAHQKGAELEAMAPPGGE